MFVKQRETILTLWVMALVGYSHGATTVTFQSKSLNVTTVSLPENTMIQQDLATVTCHEPLSTVLCSCTLKETLPANGPFGVWNLKSPTDFRVYFEGTTQGTKTLRYATIPSFQVTVNCSRQVSGVPETNEATLVVNVLPNQQPIIQNYPADRTAIDAAIAIGTDVYQVTVADPENDVLTYSMKQIPNTGALTIGAGDGVIRTAVDLRTLATNTINCNVSVSDGKNTVNDFIVIVTLNNANTRPEISNLPATINVQENQASGYVLYTLAVTDTTPQNAPLDSNCSVIPATESYKFVYEAGSGRLKLSTLSQGGTLLDYETTAQYLITCMVYDGFLYSQGDVLTLNVIDVNEPPVFSASVYYCAMPESKPGVSSCLLHLSVTDPEHNAVPTLTLLPGNSSERFRYDRFTDRLSFNVDYDVDNLQMPQNVVVTMSATDDRGATSTAKIEIYIQDANDNVCDFVPLQAAQYSLDQSSRLQTLGSLAVSDGDLTSPNNKVTYELVGANPISSSNYLAVFGNGVISYVGLIPETEHGKSFSLTVRCKDGGTPSLSATGTVLISYLTTTSSTTTTSTATTTTTPLILTTTQVADESLWDNNAFVAVFAALMGLLLLALLGALCYFCSNGSGQCQRLCQGYGREPPRQVSPASKQYDDDFVHSGQSRVSPYYKDHHWRNGDHYEDGLGYEGTSRPAMANDIFLTGGSKRLRALPAPGIGRGNL